MLRVGPSRTGRDRVDRDRPGPEREPGGVRRSVVWVVERKAECDLVSVSELVGKRHDK